MKLNPLCLLTFAIAATFLAPTSAKAYYNPSTGRWLNRDPILENAFSAHLASPSFSRQPSAELNENAFLLNDCQDHFDYLGALLGSTLCYCALTTPPQVIGPVILAGEWGDLPSQRSIRCSYANIGEVATLILYPACEAKKAIIDVCYNCAKWECKILRSYICGRVRTKQGVIPAWRFGNDAIINNCNIKDRGIVTPRKNPRRAQNEPREEQAVSAMEPQSPAFNGSSWEEQHAHP
jgi:hypothetical protein